MNIMGTHTDMHTRIQASSYTHAHTNKQENTFCFLLVSGRRNWGREKGKSEIMNQ